MKTKVQLVLRNRMSNLSNNKGRGYEYACIKELHQSIINHRKAGIIKNSSFEAAEKAYYSLSEEERKIFDKSAQSMINVLFDCEPLILEDDNDELKLYIQPDISGEEGDIRDIVIARNNLKWEIGLSVKHNHFAVKHSRLSQNIDFGNKWFGYPCSNEYFKNIEPIFSKLEEEKINGTKFSEITNKDIEIYKPVMSAFINEIKQQYKLHKDIPKLLVEYLLGKYDFYKVISIDNKQLTQMQTFNLHNSLNQSLKYQKPLIIVPVVSLPERIINIDFAPNKNNTAELYLDKGWYFSFRIHNAKTLVEPSLKFDIQIKGMPTDILTLNCIWK